MLSWAPPSPLLLLLLLVIKLLSNGLHERRSYHHLNAIVDRCIYFDTGMCSRKRALRLLSIILIMTSSLTTATAADASTSSSVREQQLQQLDAKTIDAYEILDKWKRCNVDDIPGSTTEVPSRLVYQHNRKRAAGTGFPTRLTTGKNLGLTDHETAAIFGWTTADYRLLNPIA